MTMTDLHSILGDQIVRLSDSELDRAAITLEIERSLAMASLARNQIRCTEAIIEAKKNITDPSIMSNLIGA